MTAFSEPGGGGGLSAARPGAPPLADGGADPPGSDSAATAVVQIVALAVAAIGAVSLLGWRIGAPSLTTWKAGTVPIAPSTGALCMLFAAAVGLCGRKEARLTACRLAAALGAFGMLAAGLLFALRLLGVYEPVEHLGLQIGGVFGNAPVGYISPITAACFTMANLALLVSLWSARPAWRWFAGGLGGAVATTGFAALVALVFGAPLLSGDAFIPPALNTSVILILVGSALLVHAGASRWVPLAERFQARGSGAFYLAIFSILTVVIVVGGYAYYRQVEREVRRDTEHELALVADMRVKQVAQWRRERLGDARVLTGNSPAASAVARFLKKADDLKGAETLQRWLSSYMVYRRQYDRTYLIDARGVTVLTLPAAAGPPALAISREAGEVLQTGRMVLLDFYLDERDKRAHLAMLIPVLDEAGSGPPIAVLVLRIDPEPFVRDVVQGWPTPSATAESLLVRRDGSDLLFLTNLRFQAGAALTRRIPLTDTRVLGVKAVLGQAGTAEGLDYRGEPVIGVVQPIPDSPWYLVAHMDVAEFHSVLWRRLQVIAGFGGVLLFAGGSGLGLLWRDRSARHFRQQAALVTELVESDRRLRMALAAASQGIWDLNLQTGEVVVSPEYATMLGYDPAELHESEEAFMARTHPDDRAAADAAYQDYMAGRRDTYRAEFRQRTKSGEWKWLLSSGAVMSWAADGRPLHFVGTRIDITTRKVAELRAERLARLKSALSRCNEAIACCRSEAELFPQVCEAAVTAGGVAMAWIGLTDEASRRVAPVASYGVGTGYLDGIVISVDADNPFGLGPTGRAARENRPVWSLDFSSDPATAQWHERASRYGWVSSGALPLTTEGRVIGALTVYAGSADMFDDEGCALLERMAADISFALGAIARDARRAAAEHELQESEQRYRTMFADSGVPMLLIDPASGRIVDASQTACEFYGWTRSDLLQVPITAINTLAPGRVLANMAEALSEKRGRFNFRHRLASGEIRDVEVFASRVSVRGRDLLLSTVIDVTARRQAEEAVREREHVLSGAQRIGHIGSWRVDADGQTTWSDETFRIYGLQPGGPSPRFETLVSLVHPEDRPTLQRASEANWQGASTVDDEFRVRRPDGTWCHVSRRGELQHDAQQRPYIAGTVQDVTDRRVVEESMRALLREKEALLKEVHHRVKNNLQVITSLLRLEAGRNVDSAAKSALAEMQNRILAMALLHETLYRSENLAQVDLSVYLAQLVHQLFRAMAPASGAVKLHLDLAHAVVDLDRGVPCGLLVNELVSNCLAHGFPSGRPGDVWVDLHPVGDGPELRLQVRDNGVGLPAESDRRRGSLGLQIVSDLSRQLRGTLTVGRGPGAVFTVVFAPGLLDASMVGEATP